MTLDPYEEIQALEDLLSEVRGDEPEEFRNLTRAELIYQVNKWRTQARDRAAEADYYYSRRKFEEALTAPTAHRFVTQDELDAQARVRRINYRDEWTPFDPNT